MTSYENMIEEMRREGLSETEIQQYIQEVYPNG